MRTSWFRIIGVAVVVAALSACSAAKLSYSAGAQVAHLWLDRYFSFNDSQSQLVGTALQRLHAWHRAEELPRLGGLLAQMEKLAAGETATAQQVCAFVPQLQARALAFAHAAEPPAATVALTLTPRQLERVRRKYDENNRKFHEEWMEKAKADLYEKRAEQWEDRLELLYGDLKEVQLAVVRQGVEHSVYDAQRMLAERRRRQQDLLEVLKGLANSKQSEAQARAALRGYVDRVARSPDPAYRAWQASMFDEQCRIIAAVHARATPAQRERAVQRLQDYQRDVRQLTQLRG